MTFRDHFSSRAALYTRFRPDYPSDLIAFVASLCPGRRLAWDCATGNGQAAVALAEHFDRVIATDASSEQLARAREHPRITYRQVRAEESGLEDRSIDVVTVAQALHWFDADAFYEEVRRVLKDDGVLAVWSYGDPVLDHPASDFVLQRFNHGAMGPYWPRERGVVGEAYRGMPFPFTEVPAPSFTLERAWILEELTGYLRSWSAVAKYRAAHGDDPVAAVEAELAGMWGGPEVRHNVTWPLTMRAGRMPASTKSP